MAFDPSKLPSLLNPEQLRAATHTGGPLLVLAGAGSGKTRVITYRIANLVIAHGIEPWRILAVTFTNKAAGEMKERLEKLLGPTAHEAWISTFHATGARILRRDGAAIGIPSGFVIYDDSDQLAEMKRVMKSMGVDPKLVDPRKVLHRIDDAKNHGRSPDDLAKRPGYDELSRLTPELYRRYQKSLAAAGAVDFGDLLSRLVELFEKAPDVLQKYRNRFRHVLVDEFQDTNRVQYRLLQMLAGDGRGLCVVGDDDQAIYRWRGADVTNLLSFPQDFAGAEVVKLEQNYRSTQTILDAAHAVIAHNPTRMDKRLWTEESGGAPLELVVARDERDEAQQVADRVRAALRDGVDAAEVAVFYRTNAQSRVIEEAFRLGRIPYAVVRGRSFYDRAEVKDLASYLRLAVNPLSSADALRVINKPARGIGDTTVGRIEAAAEEWGVGIVDACRQSAQIPGLNASAQGKARSFAQLVGKLALEAANGSAGAAAEAALKLSGLEDAYLAEGSDEAVDRLDNLRELVGAAKEWDQTWTPPIDPDEPEAEGPTPLAAFLEQLALLGDADEKIAGPKVALMTLHASKGLEFERVFLTGMEETVFPHSRALGDEGGIEEVAEERRLCYVGFTRAKRRLVLSLARSRVLFGNLRFNEASRFLGEVPRELFGIKGAAKPSRQTGVHVVYDDARGEPEIDLGDDDGFEDRYQVDYSFDQRPAPRQPEIRRAVVRAPAPDTGAPFRIGMPARHPSFGVGMVEGIDGDKVAVRFPGVGVKRVVARFLQAV
ncbi:ATP-dependent helicase [Vulgatibacter incomptus]|uniref:DNA 3'-5' helicase n=1 Tax=Vulgatibacter incomptus TaxID=1391653 RepID=A0A0K1P867_9BACT|nr:UvrD-helicase domain-containing protein [Vulgatibacter incomptus]AKU89631.1 ATP-dependent DNA helicase UvrD/PcrA [Vulgatibacter incomptus]